MPAGTITLTNNSTAVTGSGTAFATELKANDFLVAIVGGTTYTLGVKSVESATALTLTTAYGGPTTGGLAWTPIPNSTLVGIPAQIAADTARAIRGLNYDKQNWQQVYSANGNISVSLPDGSNWEGPSWKYLSDNMVTKVGGAVPVNQGGTGSSDVTTARANLAAASIYNSFSSQLINKNITSFPPRCGYFQANNNTWTPHASGGILAFNNSPNELTNFSNNQVSRWVYLSDDNVMYLRFTYTINGSTVDSPWKKQWGEANTTIDSNGALKPASPVVKLRGDGTAEFNDESEGAVTERLSKGVYKISGIMGFNSDPLWGGINGGYVIPANGNGLPLLWVDFEVDAGGSITLMTYHRTHPGAPDFASNKIEGVNEADPIDIPAGRWVDLRVEMPQNSTYEQRHVAMRMALDESQRATTEKAEAGQIDQ